MMAKSFLNCHMNAHYQSIVKLVEIGSWQFSAGHSLTFPRCQSKVWRQVRTRFMGIPWSGGALLQMEENYLAKAASTLIWIHLKMAFSFQKALCLTLAFQASSKSFQKSSSLRWQQGTRHDKSSHIILLV